MSGGGIKKAFSGSNIFKTLLTGNVSGALLDSAKASTSKGAGFTDKGGLGNQILDPANIFGGKQAGDAKAMQEQQAADQAAQAAAAQQQLNSILNGGSPTSQGGGIGMNYGGMGSYQPQPVQAPPLLAGPNRTPNQNQMPLLAHQAFSQVLAPLQQPNWGLQQVNPNYLTGINRFPGGQVPDGNVAPPGQGFGQMQPVQKTIQPLDPSMLRAWS